MVKQSEAEQKEPGKEIAKKDPPGITAHPRGGEGCAPTRGPPDPDVELTCKHFPACIQIPQQIIEPSQVPGASV